MEKEIYYTTKEVAQILGMNQRTIANYVKAGILEGYKISGHTVKIAKSDLDIFLQTRKIKIPLK